ncbi:tetratricopeptide repeat protein [Flavobacterium sp. N1736]|uniref:tetratricopeptide repeat protein n=1 Tax=Flavobacterium sp. N1736 TaxID=2986823 RepID=UPI0039B5FE13
MESEEESFYPNVEKSAPISVEETEPVVFEDSKKFNEIRIDPIEESIYNSIKEATTVIFEESKPSEKEPAVIVFEDLKPIEEQPKEVATVIFEEVKTLEEESDGVTPIVLEETKTFEENPSEVITVILEEPTFIADFQEVTSVVSEEVKTFEEEPIKLTTDSIEEPKAIEEQATETRFEETVKIAEENLEIGKPLDFSVNEKHSFQEWLQLAKPEPIDRSNETIEENIKEFEKTVDAIIETKPIEEKLKTPEKTHQPLTIVQTEDAEEEKKKKAQIIDKFIETNPKISPIKATAITLPPIQFDINQEDNSYLMTETLARVYLEQKKYTKAIQAYEILILKYPEKISFFADRISDIKILQQNNNNN